MQLKNKISTERLAKDRVESFSFSEKDNFLAKILAELNEGLKFSELEVPSQFDRDYFNFSGNVEKKYNSKYGEYIVVKAQVDTAFMCLCVNTGVVMTDFIKAEISAAIIDRKFEKIFNHEEDTNLYIDGQELELYYHDDNGEFLLEDMVREMIFLNKNPYPKASSFEGIKTKI